MGAGGGLGAVEEGAGAAGALGVAGAVKDGEGASERVDHLLGPGRGGIAGGERREGFGEVGLGDGPIERGVVAGALLEGEPVGLDPMLFS